MKYFDLVKKFVAGSFEATDNPKELQHFERTVYWLLWLYPNADEAMQVAAYAHDIERAFRDKTSNLFDSSDYKGSCFTVEHPRKGAEIVAKFLKDHNASDHFIKRTESLIAAHEIGGSNDQNLIKDADSISYFKIKFLTSLIKLDPTLIISQG